VPEQIRGAPHEADKHKTKIPERFFIHAF
jgi:hypothetical protein